jgi:hypothetical protein
MTVWNLDDHVYLTERLPDIRGPWHDADRVRLTEKGRALPAPSDYCQWFLRCQNAATGTTPHPVLGAVPTCDRCNAFAGGPPR